MSNVTILEDQNSLVSTSDFPNYASFPFDEFNPVQSRIFEIYNSDANVIVAAATSAGKTVCAEMMMAHEVNVRKGKAMYLAPLRALAKEKIDDWTDEKHHFGNLNMSICTGDYTLTPGRKKELENSDVIIMTSEMLNSRCRNFKSENNNWLNDIGTLVVDESHLLTVPGRGDHLEVGLMKFAEAAPNARIVFLSATMPNVDEIANWLSKSLMKKDTYLLNSTYRPCPLGIHWETYDDSKWNYHIKEQEKINSTLEIVNDHPEDRFLLFVHTKNTGQKLLDELKKLGIESEFHSSDLTKEKRHKVEKRFRSGDLRVIVATSTLAWGLNMPARRVVIVGINRGLSEVETYDIWQMAGRAGRPGYDPRGDVYILLPYSKEIDKQKELKKQASIESRLLDYVGKEDNPSYKTLAFHLVSEIHHGNVKTTQDVHDWYERSLAHYQANDLEDTIIDSTLNMLCKRGIIRKKDGEYETSAVGKISSMFYYSPFDIADLLINFSFLFDMSLQKNEFAVTYSLGNIDTNFMNYISKAEAGEMGAYSDEVKKVYRNAKDPSIKAGYAYWLLINGMSSPAFGSMARGYQFDYPRTNSVLNALDSMGAKWEQKQFFKDLQSRITYGVKSHLLPLCRIESIGKVRAQKLYAAGFKDADAVASDSDKVSRILNMKNVEDVITSAKKLALVS